MDIYYPEVWQLAPENGWLEDSFFSFWDGKFWGASGYVELQVGERVLIDGDFYDTQNQD